MLSECEGPNESRIIKRVYYGPFDDLPDVAVAVSDGGDSEFEAFTISVVKGVDNSEFHFQSLSSKDP